MSILFLNPRPRFRVKEHFDSVVPPQSPSATHKNQDLHTYMVLILDVGTTGCQYSKESGAKQALHPAHLLRLSGNPAALSGLKLRARSEAVTSRLFQRRGSAPLARHAPFPRLGTQGRAALPQGSQSRSREMGFPSRLQRLRHYSPTSGTPACRSHPPVGPQSSTRSRSTPSHSRTQTTGRRVSFPTGLLLARPFYVAFPPHTSIYAHPSEPRGKKPAGRTDARS